MKYFISLFLVISFLQAGVVSKEEINTACIAEVKRLMPSYVGKDISCNVIVKPYQSKYFAVATDNYKVKVIIGNRNKINNFLKARVLIYQNGDLIESGKWKRCLQGERGMLVNPSLMHTTHGRNT